MNVQQEGIYANLWLSSVLMSMEHTRVAVIMAILEPVEINTVEVRLIYRLFRYMHLISLKRLLQKFPPREGQNSLEVRPPSSWTGGEDFLRGVAISCDTGLNFIHSRRLICGPGDEGDPNSSRSILVPRALLTRGATRGSGQIHNRIP
jgi:hypothetical protein